MTNKKVNRSPLPGVGKADLVSRAYTIIEQPGHASNCLFKRLFIFQKYFPKIFEHNLSVFVYDAVMQ